MYNRQTRHDDTYPSIYGSWCLAFLIRQGALSAQKTPYHVTMFSFFFCEMREPKMTRNRNS